MRKKLRGGNTTESATSTISRPDRIRAAPTEPREPPRFKVNHASWGRAWIETRYLHPGICDKSFSENRLRARMP